MRVSHRRFSRNFHCFQIFVCVRLLQSPRIFGQFSAQICSCSVDTELICRKYCTEKQFDVFFAIVEVSGLLAMLFASQLTSLKGTGGTKISNDWFLQNSTLFVRQFCPKLRRVYQSRFRTISFLTQVPRMTNDREGICEHNSQLSVNYIHTFLCFLFLTIQCRCTLTWRWSCRWSAQDHTKGLSSDLESSRRSSTLWILGLFSTRTPSACRRCDSDLSNDYSPNTI